MKSFKKGTALLLCSIPLFLSGCSSKKLSSVAFSVKEEGFVMAKFNLVQKEKVRFNVSFGIAVADKKTTWENIVTKYDVSYFTLHVFSSLSLDGSADERTVRSNYYISETYRIDVSKDSLIELKDKTYSDKNVNKGEAYKVFFVEKTVELDASKFDLKGGKSSIDFTSITLDSKNKEVDTFGSHTKGKETGITCEYTYSDNTVTFNEERCIPMTFYR